MVVRSGRPCYSTRCHWGGAVSSVAGAYANLVHTTIGPIDLAVLPLAERCVGACDLLRPESFERLHRALIHYLHQPAPDSVLADIDRFMLDDNDLY